MSDTFTVITNPVLNVLISSNINSFGSEKRFQKNITISDLKGRLELLTGCSSGSMQLEVYDKNDKLVLHLTDDEGLLGSFPIDDGMRIHVVDKSHKIGEFEDLSKVEKFQLPEEEYSKRNDSVRSFLMKNKLGKYSEKQQEELKSEKNAYAEEEAEAKKIEVGSRCEIKVPSQIIRRGTVMFVGQVHFKQGWWIGIKYDEPLGKNDGSVDGKRYFECFPKYGGFVKPNHVTMGDFPEEDVDLLDEI